MRLLHLTDPPLRPLRRHNTMADAGKFTYFAGLRSRGEAPQMIAKIGGLKMEVELIDFPTWGSRKSDSIPYMPYITKEDGSIMLEVVDICKHLAVLGGKLVVDDDQYALATKFNSAPMQLADPMANIPGAPGATGPCPALDEWVPSVAPILTEAATKLGDKPFFAGDKPGFADVYVFCILMNTLDGAKAEVTAACGADVVAKFEKFIATMSELDGIKQYLAERPKVFGLPGSRLNPA